MEIVKAFLRLKGLFCVQFSFFVQQAGQFCFTESLHPLGCHMAFVGLRTVKETRCTYYIFSDIIT
jgi:hypothetical protein